MTEINPGWYGKIPFCAPGQCPFAYPDYSERYREQKVCVKDGYGYGIFVVYRGPCIPALLKQREQAETENAALKEELENIRTGAKQWLDDKTFLLTEWQDFCEMVIDVGPYRVHSSAEGEGNNE